MIIVKGLALGLAMFIVFSIVYLWALGIFGSTGAVGVDVRIFTHNYLYWIIGVLMLVLGCLIVAIWPIRVSP